MGKSLRACPGICSRHLQSELELPAEEGAGVESGSLPACHALLTK